MRVCILGLVNRSHSNDFLKAARLRKVHLFGNKFWKTKIVGNDGASAFISGDTKINAIYVSAMTGCQFFFCFSTIIATIISTTLTDQYSKWGSLFWSCHQLLASPSTALTWLDIIIVDSPYWVVAHYTGSLQMSKTQQSLHDYPYFENKPAIYMHAYIYILRLLTSHCENDSGLFI